jgi:hypothetical protein
MGVGGDVPAGLVAGGSDGRLGRRRSGRRRAPGHPPDRNQMHGLVITDADGEPLRPNLLWGRRQDGGGDH